MQIRQFEVWIADLSPRVGTEPGKTRPVLIVQTDLLNKLNHPSTLICPITSKVKPSDVLRVHLKKGLANLNVDCDVMIDQLRAIDNNRLTKRVGVVPSRIMERVKSNISDLLDLV